MENKRHYLKLSDLNLIRNQVKEQQLTKGTIPLKAEEQIKFVEYCKTRNIRVISVKNSFPALIVFAKNSKHECLFLKIKRQKGGKLSPEQREWIGFLNFNGYCVGIANGCEDAIRILEKYLAI